MYFIRLERKAILRLNPQARSLSGGDLRGAFLLRYHFIVTAPRLTLAYAGTKTLRRAVLPRRRALVAAGGRGNQQSVAVLGLPR